VVTIVAVTGGMSIAAATAALSPTDRSGDEGLKPVPTNVVLALPSGFDWPDSLVDRQLIDDQVSDVMASLEQTLGEDTAFTSLRFLPTGVVVADESLLDAVGMNESDRERLAEAGVMSLSLVGSPFDGSVQDPVAAVDALELPLASPEQVAALDDFYAVSLPNPGPLWLRTLVTEDVVVALGVEPAEAGVIAVAPKALSKDQRNAFADLNQTPNPGSLDPFSFESQQNLPAESNESGVQGGEIDLDFVFDYDGGPGVSRSEYAVIFVGLSAVITLGVVLVSLALAATEGRDERDVLVAIGAKPSSMRRLAGAKAWWMTTLGAAIALPVGVIPLWAIYSAPQINVDFVFPWLAALVLVVVVPVVAFLVAWLGSSIAQRVRPVTMSTFAHD
jgi:hypothetical protein